MKIYHIKNLLKKELLIIELPEGTDMKDPIQILKNKGNHLVYSKHNGHIISRNKLPDGEWTLLGSPDEIKEEDAELLLHYVVAFKNDNSDYLMWKDYRTENDFETSPLESFNSALESEIYWENPLGEKPKFEYDFPEDGPSDFMYESAVDDFDISSIKWNEAQEKTFDKKRTLIFVKN